MAPDVRQELGDLLVRALPEDAEFVLLWRRPGTTHATCISSLPPEGLTDFLIVELAALMEGTTRDHKIHEVSGTH